MGGGKTHQAIALIKREHTPNAPQDIFGPRNVFARGRTCLIMHRIALCMALVELLADPDTMLYFDGCDFSKCKRLIICIDSLWNIRLIATFDVVWID